MPSLWDSKEILTIIMIMTVELIVVIKYYLNSEGKKTEGLKLDNKNVRAWSERRFLRYHFKKTLSFCSQKEDWTENWTPCLNVKASDS